MAERKTVAAPTASEVGNAAEVVDNSGNPSKKEAVRLAILQLGLAAPQKTVQDYILKEYGLKMSTNHIGASKTTLLKAGAFKGLRKRKKLNQFAKVRPGRKEMAPPAKKPVVSVVETAVVSFEAAPGSGILMDDILAVRTLVDRIGIDQLHTLVDAFGK